MDRFIYKVLRVEEAKLNSNEGLDEMIKQLDELGNLGWELVAVDTGHNYFRTYYFKKSLKPEFV